MPIEMTIMPANSHAINGDHHYCRNDLENSFLINNNITAITPQQINDIQIETLAQNQSAMWKDERCKRLTSSNFGRICTATDQTDKDALASSFTKYTKLNSKAIKHGLLYEDEAVEKFESNEKVKVQKCGMFVSQEHPYLAASPDGLLGDDTVIEVKCPFTAKNKMITTQSVPWLKQDVNGKLVLDKKHNYYYQVQGQLYCTGRKTWIFIVFTICDIKYLHIEYNGHFVQDMIHKLNSFFDNHFRKAVLRRFLHKDYYSYSFQPNDVF